MTVDKGTMRQRFAAQSVIQLLLANQGRKPSRTRRARFFGRSPLHGDCLNTYLRAKGEIAVGTALMALPPEWAVFHALPIDDQGFDIDHIVVGPGGVLTINTRHHPAARVGVDADTLTVDGRAVPYLHQARFEAEAVARFLHDKQVSVASVSPVIAFIDPGEIDVRDSPAGVAVVDATTLHGWLLSLPIVLGPLERLNIIEMLDDPATWSAFAAPHDDGLMERFDALDAEIRSARNQRVYWAPLEIVGAVGVAASVIAGILLLR